MFAKWTGFTILQWFWWWIYDTDFDDCEDSDDDVDDENDDDDDDFDAGSGNDDDNDNNFDELVEKEEHFDREDLMTIDDDDYDDDDDNVDDDDNFNKVEDNKAKTKQQSHITTYKLTVTKYDHNLKMFFSMCWWKCNKLIELLWSQSTLKAILRDLLISAPSIYILLNKFSTVYINQ